MRPFGEGVFLDRGEDLWFVVLSHRVMVRARYARDPMTSLYQEIKHIPEYEYIVFGPDNGLLIGYTGWVPYSVRCHVPRNPCHRNDRVTKIMKAEQPAPVPNGSIPIVDLVQKDLNDRAAKGLRSYGTPLQAFNGRAALWDAYEEALDLVMYLRQAIEEGRILDERTANPG